MVVLLLSSDVRNIVILRVNLIKVTSSSYIVINCHHPLVIVAAEQIYPWHQKMYQYVIEFDIYC